MAKALIVSAGNNANEYLARHIGELGYTRPTIVASGGEARRRMDTNDFEVVIINTPLPDEFGHELGTDAVEKTDAGVILLAKTGTAEQIADKLQDFGVLVLAKPFTGAQFRQAVQIAASSYKRLAVLRTENAKLLDKIAQLRLVDRAKCYLIEKKGYTETDAHRLIEKRAMDTRMSRGEVAQEILEEEGGRGPARGRMRGECAAITHSRDALASSALISPLTRTASPEGEALRNAKKRTLLRPLFYIYPYFRRPCTINPAVHTSAMASAATTASQMPSTPMISGRVRMDTTWNSSVRRKEIAADTVPLFSAVKNAEPKMLKPDRIKLMQYSFMPWVVSASSPAS